MLAIVLASSRLLAEDGGQANEFRFTLNPSHPIKGNLSGFGNFGYYYNLDKEYSKYHVGWPGLIYAVKPWVQLWGGLDNTYTNYIHKSGLLELRPFAGVKFFVPNRAKINVYNLTRYEYRMTEDLESGDWTYVSRIRSSFGVEIPFTSQQKAWQPNTFYGLGEVEPFYRFDKDVIDPLRFRGGVAYVLNDRIRLEFIYYAKLTHNDVSGALAHTDNIFRLNIKIGMSKGILQKVLEPSSKD
jgi:hypothetical protein